MPRDFQRDLRHLYLSLLELLKHFWNCFPPTTEELETKLQRMHETLQRFKMAKLVPFEVSECYIRFKSQLLIYNFWFLLESCHARALASAFITHTTYEPAAAHCQLQVCNVEGTQAAK